MCLWRELDDFHERIATSKGYSFVFESTSNSTNEELKRIQLVLLGIKMLNVILYKGSKVG